MKILIVDESSDAQARYMRMLDDIDSGDVESLGLEIFLTPPHEIEDQVQDKDILIIGSGVSEQSIQIARTASTIHPGINIILFITATEYSGGAFRSAYAAGVKKVLPDSASHLDLLQELIAIYDDLKRRGRVSEGHIISMVQAKGGSGVTSIAASLGDLANDSGKKVLLWDFDVETQDLCRSLSMASVGSPVVSGWLEGSIQINKENLRSAVFELTDSFHLLPPPRVDMADGMDLVCHTDGVSLVNRLLMLIRSMYDIVIIDTAGRLGPATGALVRASDHILCVIDDSIMGLTGLNLFLQYLEPLLGTDKKLYFVLNGAARKSLAIQEVQQSLEPLFELSEKSWSLPSVPVDANGANWAGTGGTLYSMSGQSTRRALFEIARELKIAKQS